MLTYSTFWIWYYSIVSHMCKVLWLIEDPYAVNMKISPFSRYLGKNEESPTVLLYMLKHLKYFL